MNNINTSIMKRNILTTALFMMILIGTSRSQQINIPDKNIYTINGEQISFKEIINDTVPYIVVFWKMYNDKSCQELEDLNEIYIDTLKNTSVKIIAISINNNGNPEQVKPYVFGHDIEFEVYIDKNEQLKRAMCIPELPFIIVFYLKKHIIYQYPGYNPSIDEFVLEKINLLTDNNHLNNN